MSDIERTNLVIGLVFAFIAVVYSVIKLSPKHKAIDTRFIARTAVFAAISTILYTVPFLKFKLPIFPSFLEIHLDEVPALIAGFAYGPLSGTFVIVIKTLIKLPVSTTACVGEFADLLYSLAYVIPAAFIYKKHRKLKGAFIALGVSSLIQAAVASIFTAFVMLDFYVFMSPNLTKEVILIACRSINPLVTSLDWPFILYIGLPFNLLKDAFVIVITLILYKNLHRMIDRINI